MKITIKSKIIGSSVLLWASSLPAAFDWSPVTFTSETGRVDIEPTQASGHYAGHYADVTANVAGTWYLSSASRLHFETAVAMTGPLILDLQFSDLFGTNGVLDDVTSVGTSGISLRDWTNNGSSPGLSNDAEVAFGIYTGVGTASPFNNLDDGVSMGRIDTDPNSLGTSFTGHTNLLTGLTEENWVAFDYDTSRNYITAGAKGSSNGNEIELQYRHVRVVVDDSIDIPAGLSLIHI